MAKQSKNYIGFVNDHSGSMSSLASAAARDYNTNIAAIKDAATREMLDTVVSVVGIGLAGGVQRQVVVSNPHVLKPVATWPCPGGTPLYDGIGDMIDLLQSLPDASESHVSFLIMITTDGQEAHSVKHDKNSLRAKIEELNRDGRWTLVFRVPRGQGYSVQGLGVPAGNIQEWDTTSRGMEQSTAVNTAAVNSYFATRSAGAKSSNVFYTNTTAVNTSALVDISSKTSLYVVDQFHNGAQIRDFILSKRTEYLIGAAFYQLTKTEPKVSPSKLILIRENTTGKVYAGPDARKMLGLDTLNNARIHPNHGTGEYDIFIQSESINRKLVAGTGVLYWAEQGRKMTEADLNRYAGQNKAAAAAPAVPVLAQAPATGKPTASPVAAKKPKAPVVSVAPVKPLPILPLGTAGNGARVRYHMPHGVQSTFFATREQARAYAKQVGKKAYDAGPNAAKGQRHYVA